MSLEPFEFTPAFQPVESDPMVFTLKPLGLSASAAMDAAPIWDVETAVDSMFRIAGKHILSWKGGGIESAEDAAAVKRALPAIFESTDVRWKAWFTLVAQHLKDAASPSEDAAKKS